MDFVLDIVVYFLLGLLFIAVIGLLAAAGSLKDYQEEVDADGARYFSTPVGIASVILGAISFFLTHSTTATFDFGWIPVVFAAVALLLHAMWWFMYLETVLSYREKRIELKKLKKQNQVS